MKTALMFCSVLFFVVSPLHAADVTVESLYTSQFVSATTGDKISGPSIQSSITVGDELGPGYAYAGIWSNFDLNDNRLTEIDTYIGYSFPIVDGVQANLSLTAISDSKQFTAFSGNVTLSHEFQVSDAVTVTSLASWMPQRSFDGLPDGSFIELAGHFEWRPISAPGLKFVLKPSMVYDTGAYGAEPGWSNHLGLTARFRLSSIVDLELGGRADWTKDSSLNQTVRIGWTVHF